MNETPCAHDGQHKHLRHFHYRWRHQWMRHCPRRRRAWLDRDAGRDERLGRTTSSSSTKLFHGRLRYLEYLDFRLVREALIEREILLRAMPHISWSITFTLPYQIDKRFEGDAPTSKLLTLVMPWMKGRRPAWLTRLGLFMYDHLEARHPSPHQNASPDGQSRGRTAQGKFKRAYEYSVCRVEDSRLVVLNARDASARGAQFLTRRQVTKTTRHDSGWDIETKDTENETVHVHHAKILINAARRWIGDVIRNVLDIETNERVRLVRGSHIVVPKLFDHAKAYFFQGADGRIILAIPYETDFTLTGTTDALHENADQCPIYTEEEQQYPVDFTNQYFSLPISRADIV